MNIYILLGAQEAYTKFSFSPNPSVAFFAAYSKKMKAFLFVEEAYYNYEDTGIKVFSYDPAQPAVKAYQLVLAKDLKRGIVRIATYDDDIGILYVFHHETSNNENIVGVSAIDITQNTSKYLGHIKNSSNLGMSALALVSGNLLALGGANINGSSDRETLFACNLRDPALFNLGFVPIAKLPEGVKVLHARAYYYDPINGTFNIPVSTNEASQNNGPIKCSGDFPSITCETLTHQHIGSSDNSSMAQAFHQSKARHYYSVGMGEDSQIFSYSSETGFKKEADMTRMHITKMVYEASLGNNGMLVGFSDKKGVGAVTFP